MESSEQIDKIAPALAKAQAEFKEVGKSGFNKFDKYPYSTLEDYYDAVSESLKKHDLALFTSVEDVNRLENRRTQKGGAEHAVQVKIVVRVVHSSGQWIEGVGYGEGQDRADKAIYKAITGARKYALASTLGLVTSDDPEADEAVGQSESPKREPFNPDKTSPDLPDEEIKALDAQDAQPFKRLLMQEGLARGFSSNGMRVIVGGFLKTYGIGSFEAMTPTQRRDLWNKLNGGFWDKLKDKINQQGIEQHAEPQQGSSDGEPDARSGDALHGEQHTGGGDGTGDQSEVERPAGAAA